MNDFLKIYGTVKEYYESFNSRYSNMLLEQWYVVEVFIFGLPWELGNNVRLYKPKSISDAYCLALLQEVIYNFTKKSSHPPLFSSMKLNESNEEEKDSNGLLVFDELCKNDAKCNKTDLRVREMDDNSNSEEVEKESIESVGYEECCEENVEGLGIETKESVDNNKCLKKIDKFVNGNDTNKREITRGNKIAAHRIGIFSSIQTTNDPQKFANHVVESNDLGQENGFDDISLVEMTTMFEKIKGPKVKKIRKRYGLGIGGYGDSLFPILGLDGLGGHDGGDEIEL
ncbi:hypothetical protein Tco_1335066 [Tanacetum coccineum]